MPNEVIREEPLSQREKGMMEIQGQLTDDVVRLVKDNEELRQSLKVYELEVATLKELVAKVTVRGPYYVFCNICDQATCVHAQMATKIAREYHAAHRSEWKEAV